jgi:hypothetical protein
MSDREDLAALLEPVILLTAKLLADELDVTTLIQGEEHVPHRLLRRMRRHKLLEETAQMAWDNAGRELLRNLLSRQGVNLDALGVDEDRLADTFKLGFIMQMSARLDEQSQVLPPLGWRHVGVRDGSAGVAVPENGGDEASSYAMDFDPQARAIVYVAAAGDRDFGLSWRWTGSDWRPGNRIALALPSASAQPFVGFYDHSRAAMACWTLVPVDEQRSRALGVLVRDSGAELIEQAGEIPTAPLDCAFDFGVIVGWDPGRQVTVALGRTALWELDARGMWREAAIVPEQRTSRYWFAGNSGTVYDPERERVIFYWIDWDNVDLRLRSWNGSRLDDVPCHGLPERMRATRGAAFCNHSQHGATLFAGKSGQLFALRADQWVPAARYTPPPRFSKAHMAHDPDRDHLILGPGKYDTAAGSKRDEQVFYLLATDATTRLGQARIGTASATSQRLLCGNATGVHALDHDWRLRRRERADRWVTLCGPAGDRPPALALVSDGAAGFLAVARGGAVYCWTGSEWQARGQADAVFGDRAGACVGYERDSQRLIAWGGLIAGQESDQTLCFADDHWQVLDTVGSPLPRSRARRPRDEMSSCLVYDTFLGQLLLFHGGHVAALQRSGWVAVETQDLDRSVDVRQRLIAHDAGSGETLAICLRERRAVRFDVEQCTVLGDIAQAGEFVDLESANRSRPWEADWVFDVDTQEIILFVDDDLHESYALELGPLFAHAAARGPRTPLPERRSHLLPESIKAATRRAARDVVADLPDDAVEKLTGLPARLATPGMLRDMGKIVWRHRGARGVRAACAGQRIDLDALGFALDDVKSLFLDTFVEQVKSRPTPE